MKKYTLAVSALLICACGTASATDFDYSYFDLAYSKQSHDQLSGGNGYQVDGSYSLGSSFFVDASYEHNTFTDNLTSVFSYSNHSYRLGGGYHQALATSTDIVARVRYGRAYSDIDFPAAISTDNSGFDLGLGVRTASTESLELEAFLDHDTLGLNHHRTPPCISTCTLVITNETGASENVISAGVRYSLTHDFSLGTRYSHSSLQSMNDWLVYVRWAY